MERRRRRGEEEEWAVAMYVRGGKNPTTPLHFPLFSSDNDDDDDDDDDDAFFSLQI